MRFILFCCLLASISSSAQVTGGESTMQFLRLSNNPTTTAMGGIVVANPNANVMLGFANPALLRPAMHNTLSINNNFYIAGTNINNLGYAYYHPKLKTIFGALINYTNYGTLTQTNALGQVLGDVTARDYAFQISASRNYLTRWRYGASIKLANSRLNNLKSSALLADFGVLYFDTANQFYFGMNAKNFGGQLKKYNSSQASEPLPFDLQIGISKKFLKAPFRLNIIGHHLYKWDIRYDNPLDKTNSNIFGADSTVKNYDIDKIFRHINFGVDVVLSRNFEINAGYSHQRRGELAVKEKQGLAGFSFGLSVNIKKIHIYYARSTYNQAGNYNELGLNFQLKEMFGLGTTTPRGGAGFY